MIKVFVTGGTGFLGGHLIQSLLERGVGVKALARSREKAHGLEKLGVEATIGDVTDKAAIKGVMKGCDALYHLGNVARWWLPDNSLYYRINVDGTKNIMLEALEAGVRKVIYTSSLASIRQPRGEITTERTGHKRDFESHYGRSKFLAEVEIMRIHRERALPVVILNPGVIMGPGDLKTFGRSIIEFLNGRLKAIPFPESFMPLVYIDDVVEGHTLALERGSEGERYILVGHNIKLGEFFRVLSEVSNVPVPEKSLSPALFELVAFFSETLSLFTGHPPKFAVDGIRALRIGALGSNQKAREELGLNFTTLEDGLRRTVDWYRESGYVFR